MNELEENLRDFNFTNDSFLTQLSLYSIQEL